MIAVTTESETALVTSDDDLETRGGGREGELEPPCDMAKPQP